MSLKPPRRHACYISATGMEEPFKLWSAYCNVCSLVTLTMDPMACREYAFCHEQSAGWFMSRAARGWDRLEPQTP